MNAFAMEKPASRQEPRRLKTRAALLAAGLKLLADRPIDGISVDDIVRHAGVAKGSFFNHFADKDDFALAVAAEIRNGVEAKIAVANRDVGDPALRVAQGICCFVQFALAERSAAKIFARIHLSSVGADHPLNAGVRADVALGVGKKRFALASVEAGVVCVVGVAQGLLASVIAKKAKRDEARSLSIDVLTVLLTGFAIETKEARRLASFAALSLIA
jgi:AcrR family transcriptional regulator